MKDRKNNGASSGITLRYSVKIVEEEMFQIRGTIVYFRDDNGRRFSQCDGKSCVDGSCNENHVVGENVNITATGNIRVRLQKHYEVRTRTGIYLRAVSRLKLSAAYRSKRPRNYVRPAIKRHCKIQYFRFNKGTTRYTAQGTKYLSRLSREERPGAQEV